MGEIEWPKHTEADIGMLLTDDALELRLWVDGRSVTVAIPPDSEVMAVEGGVDIFTNAIDGASVAQIVATLHKARVRIAAMLAEPYLRIEIRY